MNGISSLELMSGQNSVRCQRCCSSELGRSSIRLAKEDGRGSGASLGDVVLHHVVVTVCDVRFNRLNVEGNHR